MPQPTNEKTLTKKDFVAPQDVRWCPGCGDYAILNALQTVFPQLGIPREKFVIISGIGCSSRFPYYMNTYGFHTIHGRAPTIATGVKTANPELSVWVITGDGDGLSIGGNHLMHLLRRNVDVKVLLFNNRIYGLTKGQYSPTSMPGQKTKSSPMGSIDAPINPLSFALTSEATFVARTVDNNPKHMVSVFKEAAFHKGTAFIEIMQNCVIFNNKTWGPVAGREVRDEQMVMLEEGKPLLYGSKDKKKGLVLKGLKMESIDIAEDGSNEDKVIIHNTKDPDPTYSYLLTHMSYPQLPTPMGVFRDITGRPTYEEVLVDQINDAVKQTGGVKSLESLLKGKDAWVVTEDGKIKEPEEMSIAEWPDEEESIMEEQAIDNLKKSTDPLTLALNTKIRKLYELFDFDRVGVLKTTDPISKALSHFKVYHVGCLLIYDHNELVGIVTERDILRKVCLKDQDRQNTPVSEIMTQSLDILEDTNTVSDVINHCSVGGFRHLPIKSHDHKLSVISMSQILGFIYDQVHKND